MLPKGSEQSIEPQLNWRVVAVRVMSQNENSAVDDAQDWNYQNQAAKREWGALIVTTLMALVNFNQRRQQEGLDLSEEEHHCARVEKLVRPNEENPWFLPENAL